MTTKKKNPKFKLGPPFDSHESRVCESKKKKNQIYFKESIVLKLSLFFLTVKSIILAALINNIHRPLVMAAAIDSEYFFYAFGNTTS